ncbi:MAG: DASS family sodium-coupled anion symporter [Hyphomicrobiaceae bacterium]
MASAAGSDIAASVSVRRIGLVAGPVILLVMLMTAPLGGLSTRAWAAAAVGAMMAVWWMTEAVPLAATALLPLVLFPLLGLASIETAAQSYADPLIFLFLGGFMLAKAMERWRLHRRLALLAVRVAGDGPRTQVLAVMVVTAFLSMWVSNTATAMVMLPIGQALAAGLHGRDERVGEEANGDFAAALLLGIAFAATIGGMGTLIGTPPNALFAGLMQKTYGVRIGFAEWMAIGIPVVLVLLPAAWLVLTRVALRVPATFSDATTSADGVRLLERPGPLSRGEIMVGVILTLTALAWLLRPLITSRWPGLPLSDAGIAMLAAVALFAAPVSWTRCEFLLDWSDVAGLRWDVLILFGGGLALAGVISTSGLAAAIGEAMSGLKGLPRPLLVLVLMATIVYLGELASNTAMAAVFLPVAGAAAIGMGADPLSLTLPVVLAASLGFMLPVATPPNAIVYGSGLVSAGQMMRAGAYLDVISIGLVAIVALTLAPLVLPG